MKLSIDPGNPCTIAVWIGGQPAGFVTITESLKATRPERISSFSSRIVRRLDALLAEFPHQTIEEVAIELMGDSGPTYKKKGLISLGISTGQIEGIFKGMRIPVRFIHTGADCKYQADIVCKRLGIEARANSHQADSIFVGYLAKYDQVIDDPAT